MGKLVNDGLSRLQNQSRIPASTWRQWCNLLKLDPIDAVDVWEEICHPIMLATRQVPEVPYILQMRAARLELDIFDFREEVPKILHLVAFLYSLKDERLTKGKIKSALLKFYRKAALNSPPGVHQNAFVEQFIMDLCSVILVAKVLPAATISLAGVMKPVIEGRGSTDQILQLGLKALADKPYASIVRECLEERQKYAARAAGLDGEDDGYSDDDEGETSASSGGVDEYDDDYDDYGDDEEEEEEEGEEYEDDYGDEDEDDEDDGDDEDEEDEDDEDDEDDDEEDDDDDDDEDDDYDDEDTGAMDAFLVKFKTSLHQIYELEAEVECELEEDEEKIAHIDVLLDERLKAITLFKPLQATIPSVEEAQLVARREEAKRNPTRIHKPVLGVGSSSGGSGGGGGGGGGGGAALAGADRAAMVVKGEGQGGKKASPQAGKPAQAGKAGFIETGSVEGSVDVAPSDMVEPEEVNLPELGDKAQEISKLLASIEPHEQQVWVLVVDPTADIADKRGLARMLGTEGTGANKAYNNVKQISRYLKMKHLLNVQDGVRKDRNFMIEVRAFINSTGNNRKLDPNSRQLAPLVRILDHASAALVRLEALRTNYNFANDYPERYTREAVTLYYEEALRALTDLADPEIRGQARQKADSDTNVLLAIFRAEQFAEELVKKCSAYMTRLRDAGRTKSLDDFKAAYSEEPIEFEGVDTIDALGEVSADLLVSENIGELFDEACRYAVSEAWKVMQPVHQPDQVVQRIKDGLRQVLVGTIELTPEMKRPQERPAFALQVVGLDKLTGNTNLKDFYVRVDDSGKVAYVEGFESGDFVDLFELREYKPSRVHAAAKKQKQEEDVEELQTGRKYLFSVGRTKKLFGNSPSEILNGCIRADGGGPKVFPLF